MRKLEEYKPELVKLLARNTISPKLRDAIAEILKALNQGDLTLAYELSAVKSYIATMPQPTEKHHFTESEVIGEESAYSLLDGLHHEIAFMTHNIPSGMVILSSQGVGNKPLWTQKGAPKKEHPIIALMQQEHNAIVKEAEEHWSKISPV